MERPDLKNVDPQIRAYIEHLESRLKATDHPARSAEKPIDRTEILPSEPPTTINVVTISREGFGKRTPRHHYDRQHRGGIGIFDLETQPPDQPAVLSAADEVHTLLLFTNRARVFRLPMSKLDPSEVRSKGIHLLDRQPVDAGERIVAALPVQASGFVALVSAKGGVRVLRHHLFGEHLRPGTAMFNFNEFGPLTAACWSPGDADLLLVSRQGMAIRFNEKIVPPQGGQGMRMADGDELIAITAVYDDSGVFLAGADGKGTIRLMSAFAPNKSMGGSGKIAIRNDHVVGATAVAPADDLFLISQLGKIIRFRADEVPSTEGAIQGVNCMGVRFDEVVAVIKSSPKTV